MLQIQSPFQQFFDAAGVPLSNGSIYIGATNSNPETTPITVYWDNAGTQTAVQPLKTSGGYIVRDGTPARVFTTLESFSLTVKDKKGRIVFTTLDATSLSNLKTDLAASSGASLVGSIQNLTNAVIRTLQDKCRDIVSIKDFGAIGDGVTDDTAAINAANATGQPILFPKPASFYKTNGTVIITVPIIAGLYKIFGDSVKFGLNSIKEVYPEWWGAVANTYSNTSDSTAAIQFAIDSTTTLNVSSALNQGTTARIPVHFSMGVYYINNLTISHPIVIRGSGMKNTMIKSKNNNTNLITITSVEPVEFYDMSFGVNDDMGAMIGGGYLLFDPVSESNQYSKITRCSFNDCVNAIRFVDAMFWLIDGCYFNKYSGTAINVQNGLLPDGGDSTITRCTFNNGTGIAINQINSGGLRIENNKFLGGSYHYFGNYGPTNALRTGQLIISGNSFDQSTVANIAFQRTADTTFAMSMIADNIFAVNAGTYGILVNGVAASTYLYDLVISGNIFYMRNNSLSGIHLASCSQVALLPNHFKADGGDTTTGITISQAFPSTLIMVHPQSFANVTTRYSGNQANAIFVAGAYVTFAGNPNNNITPDYTGALCLDTTNSKWYKSTGIAGNLWAALN